MKALTPFGIESLTGPSHTANWSSGRALLITSTPSLMETKIYLSSDLMDIIELLNKNSLINKINLYSKKLNSLVKYLNDSVEQ